MGSSPLTRGKPWRKVTPGKTDGLIPTHAGKTAEVGSRDGDGRAHPRSRGENAQVNCTQSIWYGSSPLTRGKLKKATNTPGPTGSSPLTRGKRNCSRQSGRQAGLIPAHAGKTEGAAGGLAGGGAHPRSRGENSPLTARPPARRGSSPLTRGKLDCRREALPQRRLIPAHAGKTNAGHSWVPLCRAHPRSRGENYNDAPHALAVEGSSPLTRGKLTS